MSALIPETLARYTDDCEWNSLDLQSFADSVPRAPVMALPEAVAERGHLRGCGGTQIFILRIKQTANFRNGGKFRIKVVIDSPDICSCERAIYFRVKDDIAPPGKGPREHLLATRELLKHG